MLATRMRQAAAGSNVAPGDTVPLAPSDLVAAADGGYTRIRLAWTRNSTNETGFKIERSPDGSTWAQIDTVEAGRTWYVDSGLTRGSTYHYRVRAYNDAGDSSYSNTDSDAVFQLSDFTYRVLLDPAQQVYTDLAGTTPVASDGDLVRRINNLGTLGGYFDVASDTRRPTWRTNVVNGKPTLRFAADDALKDGANDASNWKFLHDGSGYCVVAVFKTTSAAPNAVGVLLDTSAINSANAGFTLNYDDRTSASLQNSMRVLVAKATSGTLLADCQTHQSGVRCSAWHVHGVRYDDSLGSANLRIDNDGQWGANKSANKNGTPSSANPAGYLHIGSTVTSAFFANGDLAFLAITDSALSDDDYRTLQEYASEEFDIAELKWLGDETVIVHDVGDPDHNAWPGLCVASNGDLVLAYNKSDSHTSTYSQLIVQRSSDKGDTWSSPQVLFDTDIDGGGTDKWLVGGLTTLSDGRILLSVGKRVSGAGVVDGIGYFESGDNGVTWSSLKQLDPSWTGFSAEGGGIYELSNGDLLFPFYGQNSGDGARWSCGLLRSTDGGFTWGSQVTIAAGVPDNRKYAEPGLVEIGGTLYCFIRDDTSGNFARSTSTDNGATWSAVVQTAATTSGRMNPLKLATGEVITLMRNTNLAGNPACILYTKDGSLYQKGRVFAASPNFAQVQMTYGQFAELEDGTLCCAYASEGASNAIADVMFAKTA